jgi:hypothetical protein
MSGWDIASLASAWTVIAVLAFLFPLFFGIACGVLVWAFWWMGHD